MRRILPALLVLLAATPVVALAQNAGPPPAANAVFVELLGNAGVWSANYDRRITGHLGVRVGVGTWSGEDFWTDREVEMVSVPVMVNWLQGSGAAHLEVGAGVVAGRQRVTSRVFGETGSYGFVDLAASLGYRYQRPAGGFVFRIAFTPFYSFASDFETAYPDTGFFPSAGVSLGWAF